MKTDRGSDFAIESELLYDALNFLTEEYCRVIMLYYFFGMTDKEISKLSGLKRTAGRNRRHRALAILKKALGDQL
ncbi:MAG: sigma-70 family RNA polymerase sigma factor [Clostridiales bacterium]|nr:sigma-70 family RNA polymerase sigma factor [Clostridiales bacterium]